MVNSQTHWSPKAGKSTSRLKYVQIQCSLKSLCTGTKKSRLQESKDDFVTSQSISGRRDIPDYEMLDAKIASALKKIITSVHFRRRVSVEEQRVKTYDRFLRGRQIACMIYEYCRATGAYEAVQGLSNLFSLRLQIDDVQDFGTRWDQALLAAIEISSETVLEGSYKSKIAGFCSASDCIGFV